MAEFYTVAFKPSAEIYARAELDQQENKIITTIAQPAIVTASLAALTLLEKFNITAEVAVGHSLGELTALHWAGAIVEKSICGSPELRGASMMKSGDASGSIGSMASIAAGAQEVLAL